jgi:serine/threonine protein kinase
VNCTGCKQPLEEGARFCGYCGREIHVSDVLAGKSLRDIARDEAPLPLDRVLDLVRAIARELGRASHVARIDLRPEVIYIDADNNAKLVDAALEALRGAEPADTYAPRPAVGEDKHGYRNAPQVDYTSPEKLMGRSVDERSQVYVLGLLAYELAVGRLPFHKARGPAGMITAQLTQHPDAPSSVRADIPRAFDTFVLTLLHKDPALRPDLPGVLTALEML